MGSNNSKAEGFGGNEVYAVQSLLQYVRGKHYLSATVECQYLDHCHYCYEKKCSGHLYIVCSHGKHYVTLERGSSTIWRAYCYI